MKIVIAPDSFKGSLSAREVAQTIQEAFKSEMTDDLIDVIPMADGGEGTVDTIIGNTGGIKVEIRAAGPLSTPTYTYYGVLEDGETAVMEVANICGLPMVPKEKRNPMVTTTFGLGEMITHALDRGYRRFIIGLGGSATNDGGLGMLQALGLTCLDQHGQTVPPNGASLHKVHTINVNSLDPRLPFCDIMIASDVDNPLCGPTGASYTFGAQKGAAKEEIEILDRGLSHFASLCEQQFKRQCQSCAGAGAAGGLGFALLLIGGKLQSGADLVAQVTGLEEKIRYADWVITGEGQSDFQTLYGKVPIYVAKIAQKYGVKCILLSASLGEGYERLYPYFKSCHSITRGPISLEDSITHAKPLLAETSRNLARLLCD